MVSPPNTRMNRAGDSTSTSEQNFRRLPKTHAAESMTTARAISETSHEIPKAPSPTCFRTPRALHPTKPKIHTQTRRQVCPPNTRNKVSPRKRNKKSTEKIGRAHV